MPQPPERQAPASTSQRSQAHKRLAFLDARVSIFKLQFTVLQIIVHISALIPLAVLIWDGMHHHLTANPIQEITYRTGKTALILLVLSLACTPVNTLLGLKQVLPLRRPLGLYAFFYVCLHLFIFAVIDYGLDWQIIQETIAEKRYVLVGFAAFLLMLPLAITSTKGWQRRLGKRWKILHRLAYIVPVLAVIHFVWLIKGDPREPILFGALVAGLLLLRISAIKRSFAKIRSRLVRMAREATRRHTKGGRLPTPDP